MRSQKSRSRGKNRSNNNRQVGNIVNRVFDSSGPEGKVRGTPQQIIDKYQGLYRDAQLSGDRVAAESFAQHAEHYLRLLGEAMREQEARREAHEAQQEARRQQQEAERAKMREDRGGEGDSDDHAAQPQPQEAPKPRPRRRTRAGDSATEMMPDIPLDASQPDVIDLHDDGTSGLVETVETSESKPKARKPRAPRKPKADVATEAPEASNDAAGEPDAAE